MNRNPLGACVSQAAPVSLAPCFAEFRHPPRPACLRQRHRPGDPLAPVVHADESSYDFNSGMAVLTDMRASSTDPRWCSGT